MEKIKIRVKVLRVANSEILMKCENGTTYHWFTKSYTSPLFHTQEEEWFLISASKYIYDYPTPKNGLKNVRVLKNS